jgi:hypothetical protein
MNPVEHRIAFTLWVFIISLLLGTPAAATLILSDASYTPDSPLVIGGQQSVTVKYFISPSGATTFASVHEIQMQTDLEHAQWNIQVLVDGRDAAQQSASGSAAFVNGALLSYSTNNDVSLEVTIDGVVPLTPGDQVLMLLVKEIDNSGTVVPGSVIRLSHPVAGRPGIAGQTVYPTLTPPVVPPTPAKTAGFPVTWGIPALSLVLIIFFRSSR